MSDRRVAVIGAGAWGTALAVQAARTGCAVTLWVRDPAQAEAIRGTREAPRLPGYPLPAPIDVTSALGDILSSRPDAILLAVPVQPMRAVAAQLHPGDVPVVVCAKGVESGTGRLPLEILASVWPGARTAVLSGPNFAHEIAAGQPAAAVVAAVERAVRDQAVALLAAPGFRLYGNDDPIGAQLGGAAKNVIAIAAGAVIGAGLGENARAALVTRGLAELGRLATSLGGRAETVMGLSGLGDLLLTCTGASSRNFSVGHALGRGERLETILGARSTVAEGVATAPALVARAAGVDLPICRAVADLVTGETTLARAITAVLSRPRRDE